MQQISGTAPHPRSTRRWPRYQIDLPVRIVALNGILTAPVMGRGSDISRAGMALDAKVDLNPGDLMQLQFPTTEPSRVNAIVRHRNGNRLGLEFLSQLPPDDETKHQLGSLHRPASKKSASAQAVSVPCTSKTLDERLRRKQEELQQLKREIEVLSIAMLLLAEDEAEICKLPHRLELQTNPWPLPS
jgi:hypothetical protein